MVEAWSALLIEAHHVNAWNLAHGGLMATMAEIGTAQAGWDPEGAPCVAIDLTMQFIGAPKLGDLLEVCGTVTRRPRLRQGRPDVAGSRPLTLRRLYFLLIQRRTCAVATALGRACGRLAGAVISSTSPLGSVK